VTYALDAAGRPTSVTDAGSQTVYASQLTYAPNGAVVSYSTGNGVAHTFQYDPQRFWITDIRAHADRVDESDERPGLRA
jgi:YD repeat-containing protein